MGRRAGALHAARREWAAAARCFEAAAARLPAGRAAADAAAGGPGRVAALLHNLGAARARLGRPAAALEAFEAAAARDAGADGRRARHNADRLRAALARAAAGSASASGGGGGGDAPARARSEAK